MQEIKDEKDKEHKEFHCIEEDEGLHKGRLVNVRFLQGNEACVEGAILAGLGFYAGYPITPSTEIAEILSKRMPALGKVFIQMEDEIASMAAIIGASLGGLKSMTATSGPGFSLIQENLGLACQVEVPCVIVNVQRLGPSTGGPTSPAQQDVMQAKWGTHGDHSIIVLSPSSVQETLDLTIRAFNLSEKYRNPVILLTDEVVAHMREKVVLPSRRNLKIIERRLPHCSPEHYLPFGTGAHGVSVLANFGEGYRYHVTGLLHDVRGFPTLRQDEINEWFERVTKKITDNLDDIITYETKDTESADTVIVSYGISARSAEAAYRIAKENGKKVGFVKLITIWPFPEKLIRYIANKVSTIVVPEMNLGQLILEVERCARSEAQVIGVNRVDGEMITPDEILRVL